MQFDRRQLDGRQSGYTLIEVLVAFMILALALTVLLRIFSGGLRNVSVSSDYAIATLIAESRLAGAGIDVPLILVTTEGGLAAIQWDWGIDDVITDTSSPAEVEARLRLAVSRLRDAVGTADDLPEEIRSGELHIDEGTYTAKLRGRSLDLTFKEFELLKFLAQHPGRVFTRAVLLQEVWGYDYFGGTRTVDVHVRRLRAKLGTEHESLIGTVRNVGYRFVPEGTDAATRATMSDAADAALAVQP